MSKLTIEKIMQEFEIKSAIKKDFPSCNPFENLERCEVTCSKYYERCPTYEMKKGINHLK